MTADTKTATVAVPVGLLQELLRDRDDGSEVYAAVAALLPKPKPRLVAVIPQHMGSWMTETGKPAVLVEDLESQPDLLTLLDEAVDEVMNVTDWPQVRDGLKSRIRTALGVTDG